MCTQPHASAYMYACVPAPPPPTHTHRGYLKNLRITCFHYVRHYFDNSELFDTHCSPYIMTVEHSVAYYLTCTVEADLCGVNFCQILEQKIFIAVLKVLWYIVKLYKLYREEYLQKPPYLHEINLIFLLSVRDSGSLLFCLQDIFILKYREDWLHNNNFILCCSLTSSIITVKT
jgi:hypothetical protein